MYNYSLGMYEKALPDEMPLKDKLQIAKEAGFQHVEFCVDLNTERAARLSASREQRHQWRELAWESGVPFTTFSLTLLRKTPLGCLDPEKNREAFRVIREGCRLAADLGSRVMLINGYDVYNEPSDAATVRRFYENLPQAVAICAGYGMILGIENAEKPFCKTIADAKKICEAVPSPFLRIYGDIANSTIAFHGDAEAAVKDLEAGRGFITSLHLKDATEGEYRHQGYGDGYVDFARCIAKAKDLNIHLFNAEIFCRRDADYIGDVRKIGRFLHSYLDAD